jgi:hypothetical protein
MLNITNGHKIYQHFPIKGPQNFTQNSDFWFENKPSGNPDKTSSTKHLTKYPKYPKIKPWNRHLYFMKKEQRKLHI